MNRKLGVSIAIALSVIAGGYAYAAHSTHIWTKMSEKTASNGEKMCEWKCSAPGDFGGEHFRTTSGYGMCPKPPM